MRVWGVRVVPQRSVSSPARCGTCCPIYLLCRVYKKGFFFFLSSKHLFFIHCTPPPPFQPPVQLDLNNSCLFVLFVFVGCCEHGHEFARLCWGRPLPQDGPMTPVESRGRSHTDWARDSDGCEVVCCRHQFVGGLISFHKALPYVYYSWDK